MLLLCVKVHLHPASQSAIHWHCYVRAFIGKFLIGMPIIFANFGIQLMSNRVTGTIAILPSRGVPFDFVCAAISIPLCKCGPSRIVI